MLSCIIVDDEEPARENLHALLTNYCPDVEVVEKVGTVKDALAAIHSNDPDLVFLDIRMNNETSFDLLDQLEGEFPFQIIFITAYNEYALKAFKFSAVDYLLKPVDVDELVEAVEKAKEKQGGGERSKFDVFLQNLRNVNSTFKKIALPTLDGLTFVQVDDIIRCESADNYTHFHMTNGEKILVSKTIKYFEDLLAEQGFFRVHQSHLINLNQIKKYVKGEGGYTIMSDDSSVMVSRRKKDAFLGQLAKQ